MIFETKNGDIVSWKQQLFNLLLQDGKWEVKKYIRIRTLSQNAMYWTYIEIIADDTWNDKDYIHESLKMKFLLDRSRKLPFVRSTTSLTTTEFVKYIENIKNFMSEFGLILPSVEEFINLYN